jgi:hypothetical protein
MATNATRYRHFTAAASVKPAKIIEFGLRRAQVFFFSLLPRCCCLCRSVSKKLH